MPTLANEPTQPRELTMRDTATQAAMTAKLNSFAAAYLPDPSQAQRIEANFAKTCSPTAKLANICDSGLVKQLCFVQPNYKLSILSCPFLTQGPDNEDLIAGSLGDALDVIFPVTIRLKDVRGEILSVCTSRATAEKFKLATSKTNPLEEHGPPPPDDSVTMPEPPGPDRININIVDAANQPCFVAIPKVFPLTRGYTIPNNPAIALATTPSLPDQAPDSLINTWYETVCYGVLNLNNHSLQSSDTLFVFASIDQVELTGDNRSLTSQCTVVASGSSRL